MWTSINESYMVQLAGSSSTTLSYARTLHFLHHIKTVNQFRFLRHQKHQHFPLRRFNYLTRGFNSSRMFNKQKSKDAKDGKVRRDDQPRNAQLKPEPGGSSSKGQTKKPLDPSETLARRLQKEEDTIVKETSRKQPSIVYDDSPLKGKTKETKPQVADSRCHQPTKAHETPDRPTPSSEEYPNKIQDALDSLREYHGRIMAIRCHKCRHNITADFTVKGHIAGWEKSLDNGQQECISAVKCPVSNCLTKTCLGCGKPPQVGTNKATTSGIVLDWCCDGGKLFAIWLFLARYDELELETQNESAKAVLEAQKKASRRGKTDTGHGYAIGFDEGFINHMVGRRVALGFDPHDPGYGVSMSFNFKSSDLKTDRFVKKISGFLYHLLPNQNHKVSKSEFEIKPPAALKAILQLSLLLDKLAELLRNDSLSDLTSRADLYFKILRLVQVIGGHRDLVGLISKERFAKRLTSGLKVLSVPASKRGVSSGRNGRQSLLILEEESASSVISRVENLYKQSQIILSQYKNVKREFADAEGQDTINLCNEIMKSYSTIVDTEKAKGSVHGKEKNEWASFHAENMVEEIDMVEDSYHFSRSLEQLRHQRSLPRGRISYLVKEIATLATSLPDGIFVKVSPSTPGVLKALIIGPKDTPYEGGLFE